MKIEQKLEIKKLGPPCPEIKSKHKGRNFSSDWYKKCGWLAGCELTEKVYCFPCLLFGAAKKQEAWTHTSKILLVDQINFHFKIADHL